MSRESPVPGVRYTHPPDRSDLPVPADLVRPEELAAWLSTQFRNRLRVFAARRLRNVAAAEDVAQETLKRTLDALQAGRVRDTAALPGFVFETARHICLQRMRSEEREGRALERLAAAPGGETVSQADDPLTALISQERQAAVRQAVAQLSEPDRELLRLTYVESLDSDEIGRQLRIEPGTVRVRRHRALKRLAEWLGVTNNPDGERGT